VGANDAEAVLRSLPSVGLRYGAHDEVAQALAHWCQVQPEFTQVLHPALTQSPGHGHWKTLCKGRKGAAAGLFSVVVEARFTRIQVDAFCDALRLFRLGYSWGGPISLVVPYELATMRTTWPKHIAKGTVVRFSVGLEAFEDLRDDLDQALSQLR
jgi:cystathionine beta-lyase